MQRRSKKMVKDWVLAAREFSPKNYPTLNDSDWHNLHQRKFLFTAQVPDFQGRPRKTLTQRGHGNDDEKNSDHLAHNRSRNWVTLGAMLIWYTNPTFFWSSLPASVVKCVFTRSRSWADLRLDPSLTFPPPDAIAPLTHTTQNPKLCFLFPVFLLPISGVPAPVRRK